MQDLIPSIKLIKMTFVYIIEVPVLTGCASIFSPNYSNSDQTIKYFQSSTNYVTTENTCFIFYS